MLICISLEGIPQKRLHIMPNVNKRGTFKRPIAITSLQVKRSLKTFMKGMIPCHSSPNEIKLSLLHDWLTKSDQQKPQTDIKEIIKKR